MPLRLTYQPETYKTRDSTTKDAQGESKQISRFASVIATSVFEDWPFLLELETGKPTNYLEVTVRELGLSLYCFPLFSSCL